MTKTRRKYSKEFKLEAIQLYEQGERSFAEIERELGITTGMLAKWKQRYDGTDKADVFPGKGNLTPSEARIRELERENALLKQDKEILKKVLSMYSQDGR